MRLHASAGLQYTAQSQRSSSNASEGMDKRKQAEGKLLSSTSLYVLPAEGVAQIKGGSSTSKNWFFDQKWFFENLPTSNDLIKEKNPSQVCPSIGVLVHCRCSQVATKYNHHAHACAHTHIHTRIPFHPRDFRTESHFLPSILKAASSSVLRSKLAFKDKNVLM